MIYLKKSLTSNINKLLANVDRLEIFRETGELFPINLDIAPTNKCNQNCSFCAFRGRDDSLEINLSDAMRITGNYIRKGLKSITITGGGEPLLWKHLTKYVSTCRLMNNKLKFGLITNGKNLNKMNYEFLKRFTWIRVSLNGLDNGCFPDFKIPKNVYLTFNYVIHENTKSKKVCKLLGEVLDKYKSEGLKIQKDVHQKDDVFFNKEVDIFEEELQDRKIFISHKHLKGIPLNCFMGWLKPHLHADGKVYRCAACAIKENDNFTINPYATRPDVDKFDTSQCETCFFHDQNQFVELFMNEIIHGDFI